MTSRNMIPHSKGIHSKWLAVLDSNTQDKIVAGSLTILMQLLGSLLRLKPTTRPLVTGLKQAAH